MELKQWKDVLHIISGKNQSAVVDPNGKYPIYGSGGLMGYANDYLCEAGTTIVGRKGTINRPIFVNEPFWNIDTAFGIVPGEDINPRYLYYFCVHFNFMPLDKSTGRPSLAKGDLLKIYMPVPSLPEQERIVARIEEMFSQLDAGVETLKKTKAQLAVYRQAVFSSIIGKFDGAENKLSDVAITIDGDRGKNYPKKEEFSKEGYCLFLTAANVKPYGWAFDDNMFISKEKDSILRGGRLEKNDIVITTRGTLGNVAVYDDSVPFGTVRINSCMLIVRAKDNTVSPYYLAHYLMSPMFKRQVAKLKSGTAQPQIPANVLREIPLIIPTVSVQNTIVGELTEEFSICDSIEQTVDMALRQAEAMRQSILKDAFEGRL